MLTSLLFVSNILFGSLLIIIMLFSGRTNIRVNVYLILIIAQQISHRAFIFYISFNSLELNLLDNYPAIFSVSLVPCMFLYTRVLLTKKNNFQDDLPHFIVPLAFVVISNFIFETSHQQNSLFTFTLVGVYLLLIFRELINSKKNSQTKDKAVNVWVNVLTSAFVFIYTAGFVLKGYYGLETRDWLIDFYVVTSAVWFFLFGYIFLNPIILYGRIILLKSIVQEESSFDIWKFNPTRPVEQKHLYIKTALIESSTDLIYKLIKIQEDDQLIKENNYSIDFLSSRLAVPKSHLIYLFNYHCTYRGNDYINLIKVLKAQRLLKAGYLEHKTIESLAQECNFNSRITFFKNFKKETGVSPSEFNVNLTV